MARRALREQAAGGYLTCVLHFDPHSDSLLRPWPRWMDVAATVAFWSVLGLLMSVREVSRSGLDAPGVWGEVAEMSAEVGVWIAVTLLVFWIVRRAPAQRGAWVARIVGQLALGVVVAFGIEWLTRDVLRPLLTGPMRPEREWGFASTFTRLRLLDEVVVFVAVLAAGYARATLFQLHERRAEAERLIAERAHMMAERAHLEAQLAEARLSALRMQLNPHFLFNTLNAVSALADHDPAGVRKMIARLSSLLRRVLDVTYSAPLAPLRDEAAFLGDYLDVQRIRLSDTLCVEEAWDEGTLDALVPPLILQPLVENAIGHGIALIEEGIGTVRLSSHVEGDRLVLRVQNDGPDPSSASDAEPAGSGLGLRNTRDRLAALFSDAATLSLTPAPGGGALAEIRLPLRFGEPRPKQAETQQPMSARTILDVP